MSRPYKEMDSRFRGNDETKQPGMTKQSNNDGIGKLERLL